MNGYIINGGRPLSGKLTASGAKNAVLPMIAASLLTREETVIKNCPEISDVINMSEIIKTLGGNALREGRDLVLKTEDLKSYSVPERLCSAIRTSVLFSGALLSREGKARLYLPGGCELGARPIDIHISAFEKMGATATFGGEEIILSAGKLVGADICFPYPSVGATENVMLAAVTAEGTTRIFGAAREPEIADFAAMLRSMGAKIYGAGERTIVVEGVKKLHGTVWSPVFDRIETGTYLIMAAASGGEVEISGIKAENIYSLIAKLCENSCKIRIKNDIIYLSCGRVKKPFVAATGPYPDFPTDLQAQITVLAVLSDGKSVIEENVFPGRFSHVAELKKMGADIRQEDNRAIIFGGKRLHGAAVGSHDLRCGAALVTAGLCAEGKTVVGDVRFIERGYPEFVKKLRGLGADITEK